MAPIALFAYNRPGHLKQTVEALVRNELSQESDLFVFCDGAIKRADAGVAAVRAYARTIVGFRRVTVIERDKNMGLASSIIAGVSEIVNREGKIIVIEDDMVTSPYFLSFMNESLALYEYEDPVISMHAYLYPVAEKLPETFFLRGSDCWGWATWKRGWALFEPDGSKLLYQLKKQSLEKIFDFNGSHPYTRMLKWQAKGIINSWAIRWYASALLAGKFTLYPGRPLLCNIELDASGTHCSPTDRFAVSLADHLVRVERIPVEDHASARRAFENYYHATRQSFVKTAVGRLKRILSRGAICP
jgi:hypothetical protein